MKKMTADGVADTLLQFFCTYSIAREIHMDNATGFRSELLTTLREKQNIQANFSAPYHYQSH